MSGTRWTSQQFDEYSRRRAGNKRQEHKRVQEHKDVDREAINHGTEEATADGRNHPKFKVTIALAYSDNRERDIDGAAATLMDCLVEAIQGLPSVDS